MWKALYNLLKQDNWLILTITLLYAACYYMLPFLIFFLAAPFIVVCLLILLRKPGPVFKISVLIAGLGTVGMFLLGVSDFSSMGPFEQLLGSIILFFISGILFWLFQVVLSFVTIVSALQNVGFQTACVRSLKYHWQKVLVFLLMLSPLLNLFSVNGSDNIRGHWESGGILLLIIWCSMVVPCIMTAWVKTDPCLPPQAPKDSPLPAQAPKDSPLPAQASAAVSLPAPQPPAAVAPVAAKAPVRPAPIPDEVYNLKDSQKTIWGIFTALLKRDYQQLLFMLIIGGVILPLMPFEAFFLGIAFLYPVFLAILLRDFGGGIIAFVISLVGMAGLQDPWFLGDYLIFDSLKIASGCLIWAVALFLLSTLPISLFISFSQKVGIGKALLRTLFTHYKKSLVCMLLAFPIPMYFLLKTLKLFPDGPVWEMFLAALPFLLWFAVIEPYWMVAWVIRDPKFAPVAAPQGEKAPAPAASAATPEGEKSTEEEKKPAA